MTRLRIELRFAERRGYTPEPRLSLNIMQDHSALRIFVVCCASYYTIVSVECHSFVA